MTWHLHATNSPLLSTYAQLLVPLLSIKKINEQARGGGSLYPLKPQIMFVWHRLQEHISVAHAELFSSEGKCISVILFL